MSVERVATAVRGVVERLVRGEYREAVAQCDTSRLTADELRAIVLDYGRTLTTPPADAWEHLDAVRINDASRRAWSVRVPLWTREEGRSDLTIEMTVVLDAVGLPRVELVDLHVL